MNHAIYLQRYLTEINAATTFQLSIVWDGVSELLTRTTYNLDKVSHHLSEVLIQSASNHTLGSEISLGHLEFSVENGVHVWKQFDWLATDCRLMWQNSWGWEEITDLDSSSSISTVLCYFAVHNHNPWHQGNSTFHFGIFLSSCINSTSYKRDI